MNDRGDGLLEAALAYAARGWAVFPLQPGQKIPPRGSAGLLDASRDIDRVRHWWTNAPNANIAIRTGAASGIDVLDVDPRHGGDKSLMELQKELGRLPDTVTVRTGGGGWQFYFAHTDGLANTANRIGLRYATAVDRLKKPISGIDTRSDGGYVVAPPSLHPGYQPEGGGAFVPGLHYRWVVRAAVEAAADGTGGVVGYDRSPDGVELAPLPGWLLKEWLDAMQTRRASNGAAIARPDVFRELFLHGVGEGGRNDSVARMVGYLFRSAPRLDAVVVFEIMKLWNAAKLTPPLGDDELYTTVNSVAGKELARIAARKAGGR